MASVDGERISLGPVLNSLITAGVVAGLVATGGVSLLTWRADASEDRVEEIDKRQRTSVKSLALVKRDVQWMNSKLDAIMEAQGVAIPKAPPPLEQD